MKTKKIITLITLILTTILYSTCYAISEEDLCLGQIKLDTSLEEIKSIYGDPIKEQQLMPKGTLYTFSYFIVRDGTFKSIETKGINSLSTNKGIKFGSTGTEVKNTYGTPTIEEPNKLIMYQIRKTFKTYNGKTATMKQKLIFTLNNNIVEEIIIAEYPDDETI